MSWFISNEYTVPPEYLFGVWMFFWNLIDMWNDITCKRCKDENRDENAVSLGQSNFILCTWDRIRFRKKKKRSSKDSIEDYQVCHLYLSLESYYNLYYFVILITILMQLFYTFWYIIHVTQLCYYTFSHFGILNSCIYAFLFI